MQQTTHKYSLCQVLNKIILVKQIISYLSGLYLCEQLDNLKGLS